MERACAVPGTGSPGAPRTSRAPAHSGRRHRSSTLERSRVFRFPDMPLFGPNDGPLYQLEEDAWPLGRKRCVPPMTDSTDREWDYLKGEGPSAPDARSLALPLKPGEGKPFKLGWVVRGKPGAPESAHVRDAREANDPRRDANARRRHDSIAHNRDRTGINPITGEVVDETKARRTERALVRGPKSIPSRPAEATAWEERKWRSREPRRPVREDAIIREGLPVAPDERPTASDNFVPPEYRERRLVVTGERGEDAGASDHPRGKDARCGIGPGMTPTREASSDGVFPTARARRGFAGDLGPDLVPTSETATGFLHGAANYDFRSSGFRGGGGWKV